jgi:hypothetical protein
MIFDRKNFINSIKSFTWRGFFGALCSPFKKIRERIFEDDKASEIADGAERSSEELEKVEDDLALAEAEEKK